MLGEGSTPLSVTSPDGLAAGTINARNTVQAGAAPAGSVLEISTDGRATAAVQVMTNTLNQALLVQGTVNGTVWVTLGGTPLLNQGTGALSPNSITAAATGIWSFAVADFAKIRISTPDVAVSGSATLALETGAPAAVVAVDNIVAIAPGALTTAATPVATTLAAATNAQLLPANPLRKGCILVNRSGQEVFIRYGATAASATLFSDVIASGGRLEVPFNITAAIQAFSVSAGAAPGILATEFTA